eukprot:888656_1
MSTNNKKRPLSEISDDSTPSNKKRKVMIDDDDNKEMKGLDAAEPEEQSKLKNELMYSGEPITLNVGGLKYETSLHTLTKYRDSVLSKMFEGKFSLKPTKDGSYFIDRDGTFFGMILNYLRTGQIIIPKIDRQYVILHLLMESQFYQIASLHQELKFMSIGSNILSPQQIVEIQSMLYPSRGKHNLNWKLLCKYNILQDNCSWDDASIVKAANSVLCDGRKSVLVLMMKKANILGVFLRKEMTGDRCRFTSISDGFAFVLTDLSQKIEISSLYVGNLGISVYAPAYADNRNSSSIQLLKLMFTDQKREFSLISDSVFRLSGLKPMALEIFQL